MTYMTCHTDMMGDNDTFRQPFPNPVAMPSTMAGLEEVNAAEMVQPCMAVPMAAEPLDWGSRNLAALAAHVEDLQVRYAGQGRRRATSF